jgi:hypothetical protein
VVKKLRDAAAKVAARVTRDAVRGVGLLVVELAGSASVLKGIAHYSHPAAFIVGGIGAIFAVERSPAAAGDVAKKLETAIRERLS